MCVGRRERGLGQGTRTLSYYRSSPQPMGVRLMASLYACTSHVTTTIDLDLASALLPAIGPCTPSTADGRPQLPLLWVWNEPPCCLWGLE